jgi:hypothetical protein
MAHLIARRLPRLALPAALAAAALALAPAPSGAAIVLPTASTAMTPAAAAPGTAVLLRSSGFPPHRAAFVRFGPRLVGRGVTDAFGNLLTPMTVPPGQPPVPVPVSVYAGGARTVGLLRILAYPTTPSTRVSESTGAQLAIQTINGTPGTPFRLYGSGLPGLGLVRVRVGGVTIALGRASPRGFFSAPLALPNQVPGRRPVLVTAPGVVMRAYLDLQPPGYGAPRAPGEATVVAAGDIACSPGQPRTDFTCRQADTANLVAALNPTVVATLGDTQYNRSSIFELAYSFDSTWGRFKQLIRPAVGNHEYLGDLRASGYFGYFGAQAAPPFGYYSYDLGTWHVIVLNGNCLNVSCGQTSPQLQWLRADLSAHRNLCTLAYWHQPRYSSAGSGLNSRVRPFWIELYREGVDVVLNGDAHDYERFAPQDFDAHRDDARGIREFVVGTGGEDQGSFVRTAKNTENGFASFGVLELNLRPRSYDWVFHPVPGTPIADSGSSRCHG